MQILSKFNDSLWKAKVTVGVGVIMQDLGELHEAMRNYEEAQNVFKEIGSVACETKNIINIANLHYMLGRKEQALKCLAGIEGNRFVLSDSIYLANLLVSRFHISEFKDSMAAINAHKIGEKLGNDHLSVLTFLSMGMLRLQEKRENEGITFLKGALGIADSLHDYANLKRIYIGLEECYTRAGLYDSASICHTRMLAINDSVYRHERIDNMRKQEHLATITRYEQRLHEEQQAGKWRLTLALSAGGALVIILALLFFLLWISKRKSEINRQLEEEKNRRLELLNKQYGLEIEAKQSELSSNTLLMAQKNAQLKELAAQIEKLKEDGQQNDTDTLKEAITEQLSKDDDWRYFKLRFEKVHPGFFEKIKEAYPGLSKTDLRLCAYIKVGMSSKEIAQVLSVKTDTVNTSRYRIRKKMRLSPEISIESIIDGF